LTRQDQEPEAESLLLKKTQLKENITSYLQDVGCESGYWPVISANALIEQLRLIYVFGNWTKNH
jgi:hypothetical protein